MNAHAESSSSQELDVLVTFLLGHHGGAVNAVLYYGSCMRNKDPFDGIVDLYLITDGYRAVYSSKFRALLNWLLPPNVFYKEMAVGERTLRVKYNVLSTADLRRGLSRRSMHSYFWGRLTQPVEILWCRNETIRSDMEAFLVLAARTFLERVLPAVADSGLVSELWAQGLCLSYAAELRTERPSRAQELVNYDLQHYVATSVAVASSLRFPLEITGVGKSARYMVSVSASRRFLGRLGWVIRRVQGKILSVARLLKALFTFDGGLDYVAWKLERHSGQEIEIPDRVRRYPLIFVWGMLWKLYRRGIIR